MELAAQYGVCRAEASWNGDKPIPMGAHRLSLIIFVDIVAAVIGPKYVYRQTINFTAIVLITLPFSETDWCILQEHISTVIRPLVVLLYCFRLPITDLGFRERWKIVDSQPVCSYVMSIWHFSSTFGGLRSKEVGNDTAVFEYAPIGSCCSFRLTDTSRLSIIFSVPLSDIKR